MIRTGLLLLTLLCLAVVHDTDVGAADWPCWRGSHQNGISPETGLLKTWPDDGPVELWRTELGEGFSGIAVVGTHAYTMFANGEQEQVVCLNIANGQIVWQVASGKSLENRYGNGPRATPTVDQGRVYTHGSTGSLLCLDAETGQRIWGFNTLEEFNAENIDYGLSASPVVVDQMLIVVVGAPDGKSLVALDKLNGDVIWTSLSDQAGYSTPLLIDVDGTRQLAVMTGTSIVTVALDDGRELWRHPWKTTEDANVATPIYHDGRLFVSSGYGTGSALFELSMSDGSAVVKELWASKKMKNYFSSSVLFEGYLYGFNNTRFTCMDFQTGDVQWQARGFNRGSLLIADKMLVVLGERGTLALAEASPQEYIERANVQGILEPRTWTVPTVAQGKMFLRNEQEMVCLQLTAE